MAQNEKKPFLTGNVRISELEGFTDTQMNGIRGCFIPYDANPCLYVGQNKETGAVTIDLDILVRETQNSKSGSSHFVKLNVGKANRERLAMPQEAVDSMKIVGNLWTRVPGQSTRTQQAPGVYQGQQRQQAPAPQGGYQPRRQPSKAYRQGGYPAQQPAMQAGPVWGQQAPVEDLPAGW